jgi:glycosyltransferase involved in cell wall biosynthesis
MQSNFNYSVIMAVKNGQEYLEEAISSISNQEFLPERIIIIDDHSELKLEIKNPPKVNIQVFPALGYGQMAAINQGLKLINTEYVSFLDHDDLWERNRQNRHLQIFQNSQNLDYVVSKVTNFQKDVADITKQTDMGISRVLGAITFRTSVFEKVGLFDTDINHHGIIEWWSREEIKELQFGEDFETGLFRRIHENNSGNRYMKESRMSLFKILRELSRNYEN